MVEKREVRRSIKTLQRVKTWQLVVLLLLAAFISATFLRLNNIGMVERRDAVIEADKLGDEETIVNRLYDLQRYVATHMNTDLGRGVYLEESYNRDLQEWQSDQYGASNPNGNIYQKAQEVCAPRFSSWSTAYVQCITSELAKYPPAEGSTNSTPQPRAETYLHDYASPLWTPDFAGWSVLVCLLIALAIIIRGVSLLVLSVLLRRHYHRL